MRYKEPPASGKIKPGETRNSKGRPKGSKNRKTIVRNIASKRHTVTINGQQQQLTVLEALILKLQYAAIEKGGRAQREHQRLLKKYDVQQDEAQRYGVLVTPPEMTPEEFMIAFGVEMEGPEDTEAEPRPYLQSLNARYSE